MPERARQQARSYRPSPPFKAALAVCSDIDYATPGYFSDLHAFLNGSGETRFGPGLGLDIADSFWFYNANPETPEGISYFEGTGDQEKDAAVIRAGIREGRIDALHAYGDFSLGGGFRRELAERALAMPSPRHSSPRLCSENQLRKLSCGHP